MSTGVTFSNLAANFSHSRPLEGKVPLSHYFDELPPPIANPVPARPATGIFKLKINPKFLSQSSLAPKHVEQLNVDPSKESSRLEDAKELEQMRSRTSHQNRSFSEAVASSGFLSPVMFDPGTPESLEPATYELPKPPVNPLVENHPESSPPLSTKKQEEQKTPEEEFLNEFIHQYEITRFLELQPAQKIRNPRIPLDLKTKQSLTFTLRNLATRVNKWLADFYFRDDLRIETRKEIADYERDLADQCTKYGSRESINWTIAQQEAPEWHAFELLSKEKRDNQLEKIKSFLARNLIDLQRAMEQVEQRGDLVNKKAYNFSEKLKKIIEKLPSLDISCLKEECRNLQFMESAVGELLDRLKPELEWAFCDSNPYLDKLNPTTEIEMKDKEKIQAQKSFIYEFPDLFGKETLKLERSQDSLLVKGRMICYESICSINEIYGLLLDAYENDLSQTNRTLTQIKASLTLAIKQLEYEIASRPPRRIIYEPNSSTTA